MPPSPVLWLLGATGLWLLVLLGLDSDGLLLVGGCAALVVALLGAAVALPTWGQTLAFLALAILGYALVRRWSARSIDASVLVPPPGAEQAEVIQAFGTDGKGRVQWQGQSWAALNLEPARTLHSGERVSVLGREGNFLQVLARGEGVETQSK